MDLHRAFHCNTCKHLDVVAVVEDTLESTLEDIRNSHIHLNDKRPDYIHLGCIQLGCSLLDCSPPNNHY